MAQKLGITPLLLSRITGTIYVLPGDTVNTERRVKKLNIGLNLKFNKKNEEVGTFNDLVPKIFCF